MSGERDAVRDWALLAPIASNKQIGSHAARLVLLVLTEYVSASGTAWPSASTIAQRLAGFQRRDVRNALALLEDQHLIERAGNVAPGRATRYRFPHLAGMPATHMAGMPANPLVQHLAGMPATHLAGDLAGDLAGMPATHRTEENSSTAAREVIPMPKHQDRADSLDDAAALFSDTHPGREREALNAALAIEAKRGRQVAHPARYFATWSIDRRRAVQLPRIDRPPCPACGGEGFELDPVTLRPIRPCALCKPTRAAASG